MKKMCIPVLTRWMPVLSSYRNQSIDLLCKSSDRFLYESSTSIYWVKWRFPVYLKITTCLLPSLFYFIAYHNYHYYSIVTHSGKKRKKEKEEKESQTGKRRIKIMNKSSVGEEAFIWKQVMIMQLWQFAFIKNQVSMPCQWQFEFMKNCLIRS